MMYHRPVLTGTMMLVGGIVLGTASGALLVNGFFATLERPLTKWSLLH